MKKLILTTAICTIMACPAFADNENNNITDSNKGCVNDTLTTYSGSAELEADWSANHVAVTYYNGDNVYGSAGECTYDDTLTLPAAPSKDGYTFNGWKVKTAAQCSLSGIDTSINGTGFAFIKFDGTASTDNGSTRKVPSTYNLSNNGEWAAEFEYGTIKGISRCSTVGSGYSFGQTGNPSDDLNQDGAKYCWCQITGFDADKDGEYCPIVASLWVFAGDYGSAASCASGCASDCGFYARSIGALRVGLYANPQ